jgi:adenine deaminase
MPAWCWRGAWWLRMRPLRSRGMVEPVARRSVKAPAEDGGEFRTGGNRVETPVIGILPGKIITEHLTFEIAPEGGDKRPDVARDLVKIAVVERHGVNGNIATGFVKGFGLAARGDCVDRLPRPPQHRGGGGGCGGHGGGRGRLVEIEGGFVVVEGGRVLAELALPVAGLMSLLSFEEVREKLVLLRAAAKGLGVTLEEPFLQLAFLCLPVIPHLKITDMGMVDVDRFEVMP